MAHFIDTRTFTVIANVFVDTRPREARFTNDAKQAWVSAEIGGIVDGPLAMDNAVDLDAAKTKGIKSMVAGLADILIVPNLEAGNMLAKQLTFVALSS